MSDTTRLKESRNQVHYLRLEKFALQAQLGEVQDSANRAWKDYTAMVETASMYYQQVTALREAAEQAVEAFRYTQEYITPELLPSLEGWSHHDATVALKKALALTPTSASETKERCFQIECECSAYHPLGGLCSVCGRDYESNCDHYGKSVPPAYGDGYEQHKFQRAPTNEPLETGTVCPCFGEEVLCIECWAIRKEILRGGIPQTKHSLECTTEGCVDGCIQEGATT